VAGPPELTDDDRRRRRYEITDMVDDLLSHVRRKS
jgi:hypothetical protein